MKKLTLLTMLVVLATGLQGQDIKDFVRKRTNKAEDAAVERTGKEADKAVAKEVNKALDKIFGKEEEAETQDTSSESSSTAAASSRASSATSTATEQAMLRAMGISTNTANVKPMYEFDGFIEMTVTEYEDGKQEDDPVTYKTLLDSKSYDYGILFEDKEADAMSTIIFDAENNLMLTLADDDNERTGFAIGFTPEQIDELAEESTEENAEVADPYKTYKTGKTKNILGYKCEEYVIEDDYNITTMWITTELNKKINKQYLRNSAFTGMYAYAYASNGLVMEYIFVDKGDNDKSVMTVTDIDLNKKSSIGTAGYTIMNMSGMLQGDDDTE